MYVHSKPVTYRIVNLLLLERLLKVMYNKTRAQPCLALAKIDIISDRPYSGIIHDDTDVMRLPSNDQSKSSTISSHVRHK